MSERFQEKLQEWYLSPTRMVRDLFNINPDPWQEEALENYRTNPRLAMVANKGPGKGHPCSVRIDTPDGDRSWGNLKPGDLVFAESGAPTRVRATFSLGRQKIYRVAFDDGSSVRVTGEHLWKVKGRWERQHGDYWTVLDTEAIIRRGVTVPNGRWAQKQFIVPTQGPAQFPTAEQDIDPYLLGVWLGDGIKLKAAYAKPYPEVEAEIRRRGYATRRSAYDKMVVELPEMWTIFRRSPVFNKTSPERFVPNNYKYADVRQRIDVLCGLLDTDGSIDRDGSIQFDVTSKRLAADVVWLTRSLGGNAVMREVPKKTFYRGPDGEKIECKDCWRTVLRLPFNPFRIPHKAERWKDPYRNPSTQRYMTRFIASIEPDGEEDAMCIEVEDPSHCYLANDFVVTHNTATLSWIAWNFLLTRPRPKVVATSISGDNLRDGLWSEMAKWRAKSELLEAMFEWTSTRIFNKEMPANWWMSARTWPRSGSAEEQANTLAGLHDDYIMFILDESGSIPQAVMAAAEAALTGGPKEAHLIQAGNPTSTSGPLYKAHKNDNGLWYVIHITGDPDDPKRSTRMTVEYARAQIKEYGRNHPYVLVNIFGEFPPSSLNALIGPDEVRAAFARFYRPFQVEGTPRVIGVDISRYGDDESVFAFREGPQAYPFRTFRNLDGRDGAALLNREIQRWEPDAVFLDGTGGWATSWEDHLRTMGRSPITVQFNASPHAKLKFENKRAEMYWDMCEWIRRGGAIPADEDFLKEITETTYSIPKDVIILEPKKDLKARIGRSPDRADALALTFAEPIAPQRRVAMPAHRRISADYDPFSGLNEGMDRGGDRHYASDYDPFRGA